MASLSQRACGRQVCWTNIVNLQFGNCPRTHSAWPFVAFEEKWHVFRGFPYGNWVVKYMAVSTKLLRMNILRRHHFAFTKIGRQLHAFLFSPKAFFRRNVTFSDGFVQNILMWNVCFKLCIDIISKEMPLSIFFRAPDFESKAVSHISGSEKLMSHKIWWGSFSQFEKTVHKDVRSSKIRKCIDEDFRSYYTILDSSSS